MNINSHITSMNTCDTRETYFATRSHSTAPTRLFPASMTMCSGVPALPCCMQSCCVHPYPYQSLAFPPSPIIPVPSPYQHQLIRCASPQSQNQTKPNKSFLIKDILGTTDSSSQTTKSTGDFQQSGNQPLQSMSSMPPSMFSFYILPTQKERNKRLGYRTRTMFTQAQINELEANFKQKKYLATPERFQLAKSLGLNPVTVKTWYQNKRMKWKKEVQKVDPSCNPTRAKGRPPKYSLHDIDLVEDQIIVD